MNNIKQRLKALVDSAVGGHTFKVESAILKFTELLSLRMKERGITTSALAEKINVKPPYVSKILRGTSNFTLDSIIKIASAVEADFVFDLVPKETNQKWNSFSGENVLVFRSTSYWDSPPDNRRQSVYAGPYERMCAGPKLSLMG